MLGAAVREVLRTADQRINRIRSSPTIGAEHNLPALLIAAKFAAAEDFHQERFADQVGTDRLERIGPGRKIIAQAFRDSFRAEWRIQSKRSHLLVNKRYQ